MGPPTDAVRDGAPAPSHAPSRLEQLEAQLSHAREAQAAQAAAVERELERLSTIYERLRSDLREAREERDRAVEEARRERARRPDETAGPGGGPETLEEFVRRRLPPEPGARRELLPGRLPEVPGFEVIGVLGRGGMATVFRARRESDAQVVALKLLMTDQGHSRSRTELFLREAALMLQVDHPGLLRALDAGECAYGLYLVLPLVEGHSLASRVRRKGPLDEQEAVRIALEVGRALRYCARGGLTHRDVKPGNLLEAPDGRIQLCDFGLAALHHGDAGRPYGSPGFAAPEQIVTPDSVDERADVYGLGATLWCLVTGRRPFPGDAQASFAQARREDLSDPRLEGADISPRLARVIRRMGRADRARRYRSWDECLLDLMLVESGNPPLAAQLSEALGTDRLDEDAPSPDDLGAESETTDEPTPAGDDAGRQDVPRHAPLAVAVALAATLLLAGLLVLGFTSSPVDALEGRARALAAEGRAADAAAALRRAAELLDPAEAARIRRVAAELESR